MYIDINIEMRYNVVIMGVEKLYKNAQMEVKMPISKAQQKAVTKYVKSKYDRFGLTMPKGRLDEIKAHADSKGESVNGFVNRAIKETMERDDSGNEVSSQ